jgi:hypothetical protein
MLGTIQVLHFVSLRICFQYKINSFQIIFSVPKTAELLLDLKVNGILCSPQVAAVDTATVICEVTIM